MVSIGLPGEVDEMPLSMMRSGEKSTIKKINGQDDTKRFLESLGFIVGSTITVVSEMGGNMILNVKDTRVALNKAMATRIIV
jgi:ferrous iron transport protein A